MHTKKLHSRVRYNGLRRYKLVIIPDFPPEVHGIYVLEAVNVDDVSPYVILHTSGMFFESFPLGKVTVINSSCKPTNTPITSSALRASMTDVLSR